MDWRGKREIPEKTRRLAASSSAIPPCENPGVTLPGNEFGSPWWKASGLTSQPSLPSPSRLLVPCVGKKGLRHPNLEGRRQSSPGVYPASSGAGARYSRPRPRQRDNECVIFAGEWRSGKCEIRAHPRRGEKEEEITRKGATVAERLARSPPTNANRIQSPSASLDFRKWELFRMMPFVGGFSQGSPVSSAPSFRLCSIFNSITLIGSQDLAVKSRPNLFTHGARTKVARCPFESEEIWTALNIEVLRADDLAIEASMEQRRNEGAGETGDIRENSPTNGIVRHDSHMRKSGVNRPGMEPELPCWEASRLTAQSPWPHGLKMISSLA
ncbi:hypothetical protein PR048_020407 [Dryococelus australis]|uniref:Uncharacterized protein n=1 Tax=Dryococelus australis TaxID=614101 RepID=A0ABQ9H674_9NEOP|nr:hypothetical protein PR048_020407 [Dryococelus australis]